jgi:two-component system, OmpR family, phosphate regulon response regulator PhoB
MNERILVIDDDPTILNLMQELLVEEGYNVRTSTSSTLLLQHIQRSQPDLILLDILLGGDDGRILCRQLKANALTKHIPVILISAYIPWHEALGESCADDFLAKPFTQEKLLEMVKKHLHQQV